MCSMIRTLMYRIGSIGCVILFAWNVIFAGPGAIIDTFKRRLDAISTYSASIERVQHYRNACRVATGNICYDNRHGAVYTWKKPGRYQFFRSDFGAYGINLIKKTGWKTTVGKPVTSLAQEIDPLFRLTQIRTIPTGQLKYRGNNGDILIFSKKYHSNRMLCLGFDAKTNHCILSEIMDKNGTVIEKTKFNYKDKDALYPDALTITRIIGDTISIDSLHFLKPTLNKKLKKELFSIPKNIAWHKDMALPLWQYE